MMISKSMQILLIFSILCTFSCKDGKRATDPYGTDRVYKIAFVSDRDRHLQYQLYMMDSDGKNQMQLTDDTLSYLHPQFSPDGSKIVFYSHSYKTDDEIYMIDTDGSGCTNLTNSPFDDGFPQFSPDGTKIVFTSNRDGNREIYIMNADGCNQQRLTNNEVIDHAPQFSPDGLKILYYSISASWCYNIYTMDLDGGNKKCLTSSVIFGHLHVRIDTRTFSAYWYAPQYSHDGSKIVFTSYSASEQNVDIYIMNSDGSNRKRLTNEPGYNFNPRFFQDDKKFIFMTHRGDNFDFYTMDDDGKNQKPIYDSASGHPIFSYFSSSLYKLSGTNLSALNASYGKQAFGKSISSNTKPILPF